LLALVKFRIDFGVPAAIQSFKIKTKRNHARGKRKLEDSAGEQPTRKSPLRESKMKFSTFINNTLGSYEKKGNLAFLLMITEGNFA
jgi:hypothetical protein